MLRRSRFRNNVMSNVESRTLGYLEQWKGGDPAGLDALLDRHLPWIRAHVRKRIGPLLRKKTESCDYLLDVIIEFLRNKHDWFTARRRAISRERPRGPRGSGPAAAGRPALPGDRETARSDRRRCPHAVQPGRKSPRRRGGTVAAAWSAGDSTHEPDSRMGRTMTKGTERPREDDPVEALWTITVQPGSRGRERSPPPSVTPTRSAAPNCASGSTGRSIGEAWEWSARRKNSPSSARWPSRSSPPHLSFYDDAVQISKTIAVLP
jgi:hypothetical protein